MTSDRVLFALSALTLLASVTLSAWLAIPAWGLLWLAAILNDRRIRRP